MKESSHLSVAFEPMKLYTSQILTNTKKQDINCDMQMLGSVIMGIHDYSKLKTGDLKTIQI